MFIVLGLFKGSANICMYISFRFCYVFSFGDLFLSLAHFSNWLHFVPDLGGGFTPVLLGSE